MTKRDRKIYEFIAIPFNTEYEYRHYDNKSINRKVIKHLIYVLRAYEQAVERIYCDSTTVPSSSI